MGTRSSPIRVSLLVIPEAMASSLSGIYEALNCFELVSTFDRAAPGEPPFQVELTAATPDAMQTATGLPIAPHHTLDEISHTDIVIAPSLMVAGGKWIQGRYPAVVRWLADRHADGAMLCSACSGVLLLAETGLLEGRDATIHWAYARTFRENFPDIRLRIQEVLVTAGDHHEFVMSGASSSWHDLVLYLVARHVGPMAAQAIAKFLLLQWHEDGQAPYVVFQPPMDHADAAVLAVQEWLAERYTLPSPVREMVRRSGLPERSFKRRFKKATGYTSIEYVQQLRVREAQRRLEGGDQPIERIGWEVGYDDTSAFRRVFKRISGITPGEYRRKFRLPEFAIPRSGAEEG